jgi:hypothetical protein
MLTLLAFSAGWQTREPAGSARFSRRLRNFESGVLRVEQLYRRHEFTKYIKWL